MYNPLYFWKTYYETFMFQIFKNDYFNKLCPKTGFSKSLFFQRFIDLKVVKKCAHSNCATCVNSREILCILLESS